MAQPLTPELLVYGVTAPGDPQISPDGSSIAYTLSTGDEEKHRMLSQIWMCDRDGGNARQITQAGDRNAGARWSPDGQQIAFVSDRVKKAGIFVLPLASGGDARELTHHNQSITDLTWSPDAAHIAYTTLFNPENPDEEEPEQGAAPKVRVTRRIDYKQDGRGYLGDKRLHIWVVHVDSGERRRLTEEAVDHAFPQWSPDGTRLATYVSAANGMHSRLALIDVASGHLQYITPEEGVVGTFAWSPSGDRIIYAGDTDRTWQHDYFVYDVASGETRRLTDDLECLPVGGAPGEGAPSQPVWLDDHQVLFHAMRAGGSGLYVIDSERGGVENVASWQAQHGGFSTDREHRYVVQSRTSLDEVAELAVYDMQAGEVQVITSYSQPVLEDHPAAMWERFDIQRGKYTIEAWLLKPVDFDESKKYPVVLDIHGGPNGFYGYSFSPLHELLATNGYLVVYSNPRGSSSYGREFTQQVKEDWGGEDYLDLMAVLDEVLKRPYADADRTGVSGYSYGGYMTSWIIGQTQRFKAAVCGAPCFDLESMYGTSDISHVFGELQWGGEPHESKEWYAAHSPSTYAHRATTPTLIIHGEADERCPIGQGEQMFVALKKAGCEVEFARYPGAFHGFRRGGHPDLRVDCWQRTLDWFDARLK
jgi:dipeptidyl aminopeptidase/acylaminoacyl peptidase